MAFNQELEVTFGGQPLLLSDAQGVLEDHLRRWWPAIWRLVAPRPIWHQRTISTAYMGSDLAHRQAVGPLGARVGVPGFNWSHLPPEVRLNTYWCPIGGSRYGLALLLMGKEADQLQQYSAAGPQPISLAADSTTIAKLYIVHTLAIGQDDQLRLVVAVDRRWMWQSLPVALQQPASWAAIAAALQAAGIDQRNTPSFDFPPHPGAWTRTEAAGLLVDALAACTGTRAVFDPVAQQISYQSPPSAAQQSADLEAKASAVHDTVRIGTLTLVCPEVFCAPGEIPLPLPSGKLYRAQSASGSGSRQWIAHNTAGYDGGNASTLSDLADAIRAALDGWLSVRPRWRTLAGLEPVQLNGADDAAWWHFGYRTSDRQIQCFTHVSPLPPDCLPTEFWHYVPCAASSLPSASPSPSPSSPSPSPSPPPPPPSLSSSPSSVSSSLSSSSASSSAGLDCGQCVWECDGEAELWWLAEYCNWEQLCDCDPPTVPCGPDNDGQQIPAHCYQV